MRGIHRIRRFYFNLRDRFTPKAVILMYHRVAALPGYAYPIVVSPENFRDQMRLISGQYNPISLLDLAEALESRSIPNRAVVVTFDDGYADNYTNAFPILTEFAVPATVFVASGYIDSGREFWWDDIERIIMTPAQLPDRLTLNIRSEKRDWEIDPSGARGPLRKELHQWLKQLGIRERNEALAQLYDWAGVTASGRPEHRSMTSQELNKLANNGVVDIGAHTVNHPKLSSLSKEIQFDEISNGRQDLEEILRSPVNCFSYPYGTFDDFDEDSAEIVQRLEFMAACTTEPRRVELKSNLFHLPRYWVGDWDAGTFQEHMVDFFKN